MFRKFGLFVAAAVFGVLVFEVWRAFRVDSYRGALLTQILEFENIEDGQRMRHPHSFSNVVEVRRDRDGDGVWETHVVFVHPATANEYAILMKDNDLDGVIDEVKFTGNAEGLIYSSYDTTDDGQRDRQIIAFPNSEERSDGLVFQDINNDGVVDLAYAGYNFFDDSYDALLVFLDNCFLPTVEERGGGIQQGFWVTDHDGSRIVVNYDVDSGRWFRIEDTREFD